MNQSMILDKKYFYSIKDDFNLTSKISIIGSNHEVLHFSVQYSFIHKATV